MGEDLYLSPAAGPDEAEYAKKIIALARARNKTLWGKLKGRPVYIWCANTEEYRRYCQSSEGVGCSLGTPFGESFIVLNPSGTNVDVVSNEHFHSEHF